LSQNQWDGFAKIVQNGIVYASDPTSAVVNPGTYRVAQALGTRTVKLQYYSIKNGENKFSQGQIFGISIGTLGGLALLGMLVSFIIYKFIQPPKEDAIAKGNR